MLMLTTTILFVALLMRSRDETGVSELWQCYQSSPVSGVNQPRQHGLGREQRIVEKWDRTFQQWNKSFCSEAVRLRQCSHECPQHGSAIGEPNYLFQTAQERCRLS